MQKYKWNYKKTLRIIKNAVYSIIFFLGVFILSGSLKSDSIMDNIWHTISFYAGGSIPSLDYYFTEYKAPVNKYFGEHTLFGVYGFLSRYDTSIPRLYKPDVFVSFGSRKKGFTGNVYTIIKRYHQDFGYKGLYSMMFFLGVFYSFLFLKTNNTRRKASLLIYAFIFSPVVEMSIEERFFMDIVSLTRIKEVIFLFVLFNFLINPNKVFFRLILKYQGCCK